MNRFYRAPARLPTLATGAGARKRSQHVQVRAQDPHAALDFPDHWNAPDVRGALHAMQGWVCAYCNRELDYDRRGQVDHFRPKSATRRDFHRGYWWLAYEFSNYFLSCIFCNSAYTKGSRFLLELGAVHFGYEQHAQLADEARLLVDPADDPVEDWIRVDCRDALCRVVVLASNDRLQLMAKTTIKLFRLNRVRLIRERKEALGNAEKAYDRRDFDALRRAASRFQPHGATVRALLTLLDDPDARPPSRDEELAWLLEDIDEMLGLDARLQREGSPGDDSTRELLWMLAVLWKHPPALDSELIECWLDHCGWKPHVEPLYRQL